MRLGPEQSVAAGRPPAWGSIDPEARGGVPEAGGRHRRAGMQDPDRDGVGLLLRDHCGGVTPPVGVSSDQGTL